MAQATLTTPTFEGSADEQALAQRIFELLVRSYGALFARDAMIRQSITNLASYFAEQDGVSVEEMRARVDAAVRRNPHVFSREDRDGESFVATSRNGLSASKPVDTRHTFRERLYEPLNPLPVDDINNIVTTVRQVTPAPEPVLISAFWRGLPSETASPVETLGVDEAQPEVVAAPAVQPEVVEAISEAPAVPVTSIVLSDGAIVDLAAPRDELIAQFGSLLQAEVRTALEDDPLRRVVSFGDHFYAADALPNFGKNDLRRIRDFIVEQGEPVLDVTILTDLYRERPTSANFDIVRFALDYRLLREKDFEFVGVPGANLWSARGLPAIGGKRLKASDIGQLLSYLPDGYDDSYAEGVGDIALHPLTFFEWEYGVLPYNAALAAILPPPLLDDQRTAVIRIESAQHYAATVCELRYPTGARGGWLWGLEEFFHEYLVPGVTISLAPTDEPNVFTISYDEAPATETKLLNLEERRNRFVFMPVTYYAVVDEALLPSQARYNKLRNLKPLHMNDRKKADVVLSHVFETVGEQLGSKEEPLYWITFEELHLATNVLRPLSSAYLAHLLSSDEAFYADETTIGAWYYKPAPEEVAAEAEDDEDAVLQYDEDDE